jgi:hypothetical protein
METRRETIDIDDKVDFEDIVQFVFSKEPADPCTIDLHLAPESADEFTSDADADMFLEIYVDFALQGCRMLWGEDVNLRNLSKEQFSLLNRYMNSVGVKLHVLCNEDSADPWELAEKNVPIDFLRVSVSNLRLAGHQSACRLPV